LAHQDSTKQDLMNESPNLKDQAKVIKSNWGSLFNFIEDPLKTANKLTNNDQNDEQKYQRLISSAVGGFS
jgi:hypothetical protein